jgi:hypothetical protein
MPIDDHPGDKPDAIPSAGATPGEYAKVAAADLSDTASDTNPATMAPAPSYLRLCALEDTTKAAKSKVTGMVGPIADTTGNPLGSAYRVGHFMP